MYLIILYSGNQHTYIAKLPANMDDDFDFITFIDELGLESTLCQYMVTDDYVLRPISKNP